MLTGWEWLLIIIFFIIIVGSFISYRSHKREVVKSRITRIEDSVRRAKSLVMEFNLGTEYETALDGIRTELSELYIKPKAGPAVDKFLSNCEETVNELSKCVEEKDKERVKRTISVLRDRIADIRSEFRR